MRENVVALNPARPGLIKIAIGCCCALFFLLFLFFVVCLSASPQLPTAGQGWLAGLRAYCAHALLTRFGVFAWGLPLACLISILLLWRAKAVNSLPPLWAGVVWTIICASCLAGMTIGESGNIPEIGRLMAANLEAQLGHWISLLLVFNLCLLGLALVCWATMPWLRQWRKKTAGDNGGSVLSEQDLLRQAVLQGVKDAQSALAQVVQVEVEAPGNNEDLQPGLNLDTREEEEMVVVNISIDQHPTALFSGNDVPQGAYLRGRGQAPAPEDEPFDSMHSEKQPLEPANAMPAWNTPEAAQAPISDEEEIYVVDDQSGALLMQAQDGQPEAGEGKALYSFDAAEANLAAVAESAGPGPRILARQDEPVLDSGGVVAITGSNYQLPSLDLLQPPPPARLETQSDLLAHNSRLLEEKLANFGVQGQVVEVAPGPVVTMYEFKPAPGVKISKVAGLSDDLAMNLKAMSVRIVAPIPGKSVIGIEIPSPQREMVYLRELLASDAYRQSASPLSVALGKDILGQPVVSDLSRMPHLLIAGATGAGKSVFINTLVLSILYRSTPEQVRLLMIDPKRIELSTYNHIPHLLYPIITQPKEATAGLRWAVAEMERRYDLLAELGVRNITSYNQRVAEYPEKTQLPYLLVIIDELADLMMVASKEVETLITRLAQMARASGIHLVLATQRPSVDVITGLIKANFPARLSFQVSSRIDSRTILDTQGAENLLGAGDMLFLPPGTAGLRRLHGAFVSDEEIERVVEFVRGQGQPVYDESIVQGGREAENGEEADEEDELYREAVAVVKQSGQASISYIQRRLRVGYNRAARMIEQMEQDGIVGPSDGSRPREVLIRE